MTKKAYLFAVSLVLFGCGGTKTVVWKPGATEADVKRDTFECKRDAHLMHPIIGLGLAKLPLIERDTRLCMEGRGYAFSEVPKNALARPAPTPIPEPPSQASKADIVRDFMECQRSADNVLVGVTDADVAGPKFEQIMSTCVGARGWAVPGGPALAHPRVTEADLQRTGVMRDMEECSQNVLADTASASGKIRACLRSRGWVLE